VNEPNLTTAMALYALTDRTLYG